MHKFKMPENTDITLVIYTNYTRKSIVGTKFKYTIINYLFYIFNKLYLHAYQGSGRRKLFSILNSYTIINLFSKL